MSSNRQRCCLESGCTVRIDALNQADFTVLVLPPKYRKTVSWSCYERRWFLVWVFEQFVEEEIKRYDIIAEGARGLDSDTFSR